MGEIMLILERLPGIRIRCIIREGTRHIGNLIYADGAEKKLFDGQKWGTPRGYESRAKKRNLVRAAIRDIRHADIPPTGMIIKLRPEDNT